MYISINGLKLLEEWQKLITDMMVNLLLSLIEKTKNYPVLVPLTFSNPKEIERIQALKRGDAIKVFGQIDSSDNLNVYLDKRLNY